LHVVLINNGGNLIHRQMPWGDAVGGAAGIENAMKSGLQVVAVFVQKDADGEASGPFWDEYSTNSMYAVQETWEGLAIAQHDIAPASTRIRETLNDGQLRAVRQIDPKLSGPTMGKGANWDVYEDGSGSLYTAKLAEARTLVGYPGA
jgi:hypothetical protein